MQKRKLVSLVFFVFSIFLIATAVTISTIPVSGNNCTKTAEDPDGDCVEGALDNCPADHGHSADGCDDPEDVSDDDDDDDDDDGCTDCNPPIQISHFEPESVDLGTSGNLTIRGNNFTNNTTVSVDGFGQVGVLDRDVEFIVISMPPFASPGEYTITLEDAARGTASKSLPVTGETATATPTIIIQPTATATPPINSPKDILEQLTNVLRANCPNNYNGNYSFLEEMTIATAYLYVTSPDVCQLVDEFYLLTIGRNDTPYAMSVLHHVALNCPEQTMGIVLGLATGYAVDHDETLNLLDTLTEIDTSVCDGEIRTPKVLIDQCVASQYDDFANARYGQIDNQVVNFDIELNDRGYYCDVLNFINIIGPPTQGQIDLFNYLDESCGDSEESALNKIKELIDVGWDLNHPDLENLQIFCGNVLPVIEPELTIIIPEPLINLGCDALDLYPFINFYDDMSPDDKDKLTNATQQDPTIDICGDVLPYYQATGILKVGEPPATPTPIPTVTPRVINVDPDFTPLPTVQPPTSTPESSEPTATPTTSPRPPGPCDILEDLAWQECGYAHPLGLFVVRDQRTLSTNLYVLDYTETGYRQLTFFSDGETISHSSISPNGQYMAYLVTDATGLIQIGWQEVAAIGEDSRALWDDATIWTVNEPFEVVYGSIAWYPSRDNFVDDHILLTLQNTDDNNSPAIYSLYIGQLDPVLVLHGQNPVVHPETFNSRTRFAISFERNGRILLAQEDSLQFLEISHPDGTESEWVDGYNDEDTRCHSAAYSRQQTVFLCVINGETIPFLVNGMDAPIPIELDTTDISDIGVGPIADLFTYTSPAINPSSPANHRIHLVMVGDEDSVSIPLLPNLGSAYGLWWNLALER